jgi:hypothetical protein
VVWLEVGALDDFLGCLKGVNVGVYLDISVPPRIVNIHSDALLESSFSIFLHSKIYFYQILIIPRPRTSDYRWTEWQRNVHFANGLSVGYPWHFKSNKGIITKFK